MIIEIKVKCVVPVGVSASFFHNRMNTNHLKFVNEIITFNNNLVFPVREIDSIQISDESIVSVYGSTTRPRGVTKALYAPGSLKPYYLTFSCNVKADIVGLREVYSVGLAEGKHEEPLDLDDSDISRIGIEIICTEFGVLVCDLLFCCNVAIPGGVSSGPLLLFADNAFINKMRGPSSYLAEATTKARELGWPPIRTLSVKDVWNWVLNIPDFNLKVGRSRVGRAVAALSQLLWTDDDSLATTFIWSLLALEGLYTHGHEGIKSQLMEKTELFLGERSNHKKKFNRIYDFRSRFVHGDVNLDFAYSQLTFEGHNEQFWSDTWEVGEIAASMLLATIQELIVRNWIDFNFSYDITGVPLKSDIQS